MHLLRTMTGLRFLPYSQAYKLACHSLMGRHYAPESETMLGLLLTALAVARISLFLLSSLSPNSHESLQRGLGILIHRAGYITGMELSS